jgi:hypothetical protein
MRCPDAQLVVEIEQYERRHQGRGRQWIIMVVKGCALMFQLTLRKRQGVDLRNGKLS